MRVEHWSYQEFDGLNPYIKNRDVDGRINKQIKLFRKSGILETHKVFYVGEVVKPFSGYKRGDLCRLDGNTRAATYRLKPEFIPKDGFIAFIIPLISEEQADKEYYAIDSSDAVETTTDKLSGIHRKLKFNPKSNKIKKGQYTTTLKKAAKYIRTNNGTLDAEKNEKKVRYFFDAIKFIDSTKITDECAYFSINMFTCFLLIGKKYGITNKFKELAEQFMNDPEIKVANGKTDGVSYVLNILYEKYEEVWNSNGGQNEKSSKEIFYNSLYALDAYMNDKKVPTHGKLFTNIEAGHKFYTNYIK